MALGDPMVPAPAGACPACSPASADAAPAVRRPKRRGVTARCCSLAATAGGGTARPRLAIGESSTSGVLARASSSACACRRNGFAERMRGGGGSMSRSAAWNSRADDAAAAQHQHPVRTRRARAAAWVSGGSTRALACPRPRAARTLTLTSEAQRTAQRLALARRSIATGHDRHPPRPTVERARRQVPGLGMAVSAGAPPPPLGGAAAGDLP